MLSSIGYVPLLRTKVAEVDAYKNLSHGVKDAILPVFLVRPYPNAGHLSLTVDRVMEAVDGRPFGFGLDETKQNDANPRAAQREFDALFSSTGGFSSYYSFVDDVPGAIPILQPTRSPDNLLIQLGRADDINRGLIVHARRDFFPPVLNIAGSVPPLPHDTIFLIDAGWSRNLEFNEAWLALTISRITSAIADPEIVTCASSFPDSFSDVIGSATKRMHERHLFDAMRRRFNDTRLTFGDWGSTRIEQSGGGGTIPPRVDIPRPDGWTINRADEAQPETYEDMARLAEQSEAFIAMPDCYGRRMVSETPGANGITGTAKSTRARINMHLTLHSGAHDTLDTVDEAYED